MITLTAAMIIACIVTTSYLTSFPFLFFVNADTNNIYKKFLSQFTFTSLILPSSNNDNENKVSYNTFQDKIAPEFDNTGDGINAVNINNGQPISMTSLKGKVVLVNFWTYSCINVLRTVPHLIEWNAKYGGDKGLVIVGVHTPEFEFEKNTDFVKTSLQKYGIKYPVIQDNDYKIWKSYGNNYWPRMYLVDDQGFVRYDKIGEGDYKQTEQAIQSLLDERNNSQKIKNMNIVGTALSYENKSQFNPASNINNFLEQPVDFSKIKTPELYFGNQGSNSAVGNSEGVFEPGQTEIYNLSSITSNSSIEPNKIYLEGKWKNNHDNLELQSDTGRIILIYSAQYVNLIAGGKGQGTVYEDDTLLHNNYKGVDTKNNDSKFVVDYPRLYNIVNHQSYGNENFHSLMIDVKGKGFQAYVFTFG
jgi:thiol-disulfide isomerase/thioredoxin